MSFAGGLLVEDDGVQKADAVVVLGGDQYGTRIIKGASLVQAGYAPKVFVSGPVNVLGHESDETIVYAGRQGFAATLFEAVPLTQADGSTRSEARAIGAQLQQKGIHKVLLVTSNYHTRRAAWLWRQENPWLQVVVVPAPDPYFTPDSWWKSREGEKTFLLEWTKTLASHVGA